MKQFIILLIVLAILCGSLVTTAVLTRVQAGSDGPSGPPYTAPSIGLRPWQGAVGDWVKVTGSGWDANEEVTVTFDGTPFPPVTCDTSGALILSIQVPPPLAHGNRTVTAQGNHGHSDQVEFVKENFDVYEYDHFAIHYTTDGLDKDCVGNVSDLHDTNGDLIPNGRPDCVDMIAKSAELCWDAEVDTFGYVPPTSASWLDKYHIYIVGEGACNNADGPGIDPSDSYIQIPLAFTRTEYLDWYYNTNPRIFGPILCLGHELYNVITTKYCAMAPQAAGSCIPGWIGEGSAVWMGHEVNTYYVGNVSDWNPYIPGNYLADSWIGRDPTDCNGELAYEGCLFFYFLADNSQINFTGTGIQRDVVKTYWEEVRAHGFLDNKQNFDHALSNAPEGNNSFNGAFMAFAQANYFHDSWYPKWELGAEVTTHTVDLKTASYIDVLSGSDDIHYLNHYGAEYFKIEASEGQYVRIKFTGEDPLAHFFLLAYPEGNESQGCSPILTNGQGEVTVKASNTVLIVGRLDDQLPNADGVGHFRIELKVKVQPAVTMSLSAASIPLGQSITANATIAIPGGGANFPALGGTVDFYAKAINTDWSKLNTLLVSGAAPVTVSLPMTLGQAGSWSLRAIYNGDDNYSNSTSGVVGFTVEQLTPEVTTQLSASSITVGKNITDNITVIGLQGITPIGKVEVYVNEKRPAVATLSLVDGTAQFTYKPAAVGKYNFVVKYLGDINYKPATSKPEEFKVLLPFLRIQWFSPIDLSIEDPDGLVIDKQSSQIPDATYTEGLVIIPDPKIGQYQITVIPKPGVSPTDKFSIEVNEGEWTIPLATDVEVQNIGYQPYVVQVTDQGNAEVVPRYAIWGNSTTTNAMLWSGSGAKITGNVSSNDGITMSGSNNVINGIVCYVSKLTISGSKDTFTSSQKVSPRPMPVRFALADYQPGGSEAVKAQNAGEYHSVNGNFNVSTSGTVMDGLYYVKGNVGLSGSNIKGTFTIVAEGTISISGSGMNCSAYSSGLLFFSKGSSLVLSGSNGSLGGIVYVPTGQIAISGSGNKINGGLFGDKITLSGSNMIINAK